MALPSRSAGGGGSALPLDNARVADRLLEIADLLDAQDANPFRVGAYRRAAETVRALPRPVHEAVAEAGPEGLLDLPGTGRSLARAIAALAREDQLALLSGLRGAGRPERVLTTVPGIGSELARRIHDELGIETLQELEIAAHRLPRIAPRRFNPTGAAWLPILISGKKRTNAVPASSASRSVRVAASVPHPEDEETSVAGTTSCPTG